MYIDREVRGVWFTAWLDGPNRSAMLEVRHPPTGYGFRIGRESEVDDGFSLWICGPPGTVHIHKDIWTAPNEQIVWPPEFRRQTAVALWPPETEGALRERFWIMYLARRVFSISRTYRRRRIDRPTRRPSRI